MTRNTSSPLTPILWSTNQSRSILLLGSVLAFASGSLSQGQTPLLVRLNQPQQQVVMMGADMERSAGALQSAKNKDEIIRWVFDGTEGVDFLRLSFNKHQELERGKKKLEIYDKQIASMQQIKAVRPSILFWAVPVTDFGGYKHENNMPDWIYRGGGYNGGKYDPDMLDVGLYAKFLADYLELMHQNDVSIFCLSVTKEWSQVISSVKASEVIRLLQKECRDRKVPMPVIVGPASWSVTGGINDLKRIQKLGDASLYSGFSTHKYNKSGTEKNVRAFVELAKSMEKRAFNDEAGMGAAGKTSGTEPEFERPLLSFFYRAADYRAGLAGEVFFENWSRGINSETRSIYFKKGGRAKRLRAHYLFLEFAASAMKSWYIPTRFQFPQEDLETMAFWKGTQLTIWVMNKSESKSKEIDIRLTGGDLSKAEVGIASWIKASEVISGARTEAKTSSRSRFQFSAEPSSINVISFQLRRKSR